MRNACNVLKLSAFVLELVTERTPLDAETGRVCVE